MKGGKVEHLQQTNQRGTTTTLSKQEFYSGALPKPEDLAKYDALVAGAAERFLVMAEKEQENRIQLHHQVLDDHRAFRFKAFAEARLGMWLGLCSFVVIILFCTFVATINPYAAVAAFGSSFLIAGIFVTRRYKKDSPKPPEE